MPLHKNNDRQDFRARQSWGLPLALSRDGRSEHAFRARGRWRQALALGTIDCAACASFQVIQQGVSMDESCIANCAARRRLRVGYARCKARHDSQIG